LLWRQLLRQLLLFRRPNWRHPDCIRFGAGWLDITGGGGRIFTVFLFVFELTLAGGRLMALLGLSASCTPSSFIEKIRTCEEKSCGIQPQELFSFQSLIKDKTCVAD
jgi:hypothetical protein